MKLTKLFLIILITILSVSLVSAADPGHSASVVGPGSFETGNYSFPGSLNITLRAAIGTISNSLATFGINSTNAFGSIRIINGSGAEHFFINGTTGLVGIGTQTPNAILDVKSQNPDANTNLFAVSRTGAETAFSISNTANYYQLVHFSRSYGNSGEAAAGVLFDGLNSRSGTGGVTNAVTINVTFNPNAGNDEFRGLNIRPTINHTQGANGSYVGLLVNPQEVSVNGTVANANYIAKFGVNNSFKVVITPAGYLGIGNTKPSSLLHLGTGNITLSGGWITNVSSPLVASDVATKAYVDALNTSSSASDDWNLSSNTLFPKDLSYNVSIGKATSMAKLDVNGSFAAIRNLGGNTIVGINSFAIGTVAAGSNITSIGLGSFAGGYSNSRIASVGRGAFAQGYAFTAGNDILANGDGSFAQGFSNFGLEASGSGAFAQGYADTLSNITSSGLGAFAQGYGFLGNITATNRGAFAQGSAFGGNISASGMGSFAQGYSGFHGSITASGIGAMARGYVPNYVNSSILATGEGSMAIGRSDKGNITASGLGSFAGGSANAGNIISSGQGSFVWGNASSSSGAYGIVFGTGISNTISKSFSVGFDSATPTLFVNGSAVGIGTSSPSSVLHIRDGTVSPQVLVEGYSTGAVTETPNIVFRTNNNQGTFDVGKIGVTGYRPDNTNYLSLYANNGSYGSGTLREVLRLDGSGNLTVVRTYGEGSANGLTFQSSSIGGYKIIQVGMQQAGGWYGEDLRIKAGDAESTATGASNNFGGNVLIYGGAATSNAGAAQGNVLLAYNGTASTGNVGIGKANPGALLHLGTGNITLSGGWITNVSNPLVASDVATKSYVDSLTGGAGSTLWSRSGTNTYLNNTEDNVGIGTTAPGYKLDVNGTAQVATRLFINDSQGASYTAYQAAITIGSASGATDQGLIAFGNGARGGRITGSNSGAGNVRFGFQASNITFANLEYYTFQNNNPQDVFILNPNWSPATGTSSGSVINIQPTINQTNVSHATFGVTRGIYINPTIRNASDFRALEIASNQNYSIYQSGASAKNYFAGNVGIGTSDPNATLHVAGTTVLGTIQVTGTAVPLTVSGAGAGINLVARSLSSWSATPASGDRFVLYNPADSFRISNTSGSDFLTISSTGRVGIGTTSPSAKLEIAGANAQLILNRSDSTTSYIQFYKDEGHGVAYIGSDLEGSNGRDINFWTKASGSSHRKTLTIQGSGNISLNAGGWITNLSNPLVSTDAATKAYVDALNSSSGAADDWNVSGSNLFPKDLSYKVGIGTTTPSAALHVQGNASIENLNVTNKTFLGGQVVVGTPTNTNAFFYIDGTGWGKGSGVGFQYTSNDADNSFFQMPSGQALYLNTKNTSTAASTTFDSVSLRFRGTYWNGVSSANNDAVILNDVTGNNTQLLSFRTGETNRLIIDQSGNVTIGQGASKYTFQVEGNTNLSGSLYIPSLGGNVGIGTPGPGSWKLYVNGSTNIDGGLALHVPADQANGARGISIQPSTYDGRQNITVWGNGGGGLNINTISTGSGSMTTQIFMDPGSAYISLGTGTAGATERIRILAGGNISVSSNYITNLATPLASTDAATKGYVDSVTGGAGNSTDTYIPYVGASKNIDLNSRNLSLLRGTILSVNTPNPGYALNNTINDPIIFPYESGGYGRAAILGASSVGGSTSGFTIRNMPFGRQYGTVGVVGAADNSGGGRGSVGVYGYSLFNATGTHTNTNDVAGIYGLSELGAANTDFRGSLYGVYGKADASGTTGENASTVYGIYGTAIGRSNDTVYGGYFSGTNSGTSTRPVFGVYSAAGMNYFAGATNFSNNVRINSTHLALGSAANPVHFTQKSSGDLHIGFENTNARTIYLNTTATPFNGNYGTIVGQASTVQFGTNDFTSIGSNLRYSPAGNGGGELSLVSQTAGGVSIWGNPQSENRTLFIGGSAQPSASGISFGKSTIDGSVYSPYGTGRIIITGNANITNNLFVTTTGIRQIAGNYTMGSGGWITNLSNPLVSSDAATKAYVDSLTGGAGSTLWSRSGTSTYLNNTGDKVGIGTVSPTQKLDVAGGIAYGTSDHRDFIEVAEYQTGNTDTNITINTNIPFVSSAVMPYITITGYAYGRSEVIDLSIAFYIYDNGFTSQVASSGGTYLPTALSLFNNTAGNVSINLYDQAGLYYGRFKVSARKTLSELDSYMYGWTIDNKGIPTSGISDNVNVTIESSVQRLGIGTEDPNGLLHVYNGSNDVLFANSIGRVGIGTGSPQYVFHVNHTSTTVGQFESSGGDAEITLYSAADSVDNKRFGLYSSGGQFIVRALNDAYNTGTNAIVVDRSGNSITQVTFPNGNVGIGTNAPSARFDINGTNATLRISSGIDNAGVATLLFGHRATSTDVQQKTAIISQAVGDWGRSSLHLATNIVQDNSNVSILDARLTVSGSTGNVGIGTTNPQARLHVAGNITSGGWITNLSNPLVSSDAATKAYVDSITGGAGTSVWSRSSPGITYVNNTADNVSIGSTTSTDKLFIQSGNGDTSSGGTLGLSNGAQTYRLYFTSSNNNLYLGVPGLRLAGFSPQGDVALGGLSGDNFPGGGSPDFYLNGTTGNLGIGTGTNQPGNKLEVYGGNISINGADSAGALLFTRGPNKNITTTQAGIWFEHNGGLAGNDEALVFDLGDVTQTTDYRFKANKTDRLVINGNGNVGIGTSNPVSTLFVNSSNTAGGFIVQNTTGSLAFIVNGSSGTVGIGAGAKLNSSNTDTLFIMPNNNARAAIHLSTRSGQSNDPHAYFAVSDNSATSPLTGTAFNGLEIGVARPDLGSAGYPIRFVTNDVSSTREVLRINPDGNLSLSAGKWINNVSNPLVSTDVATKAYVDSLTGGAGSSVWSKNAGNVYLNTTSDNVSIGSTTSPNYRFQVVGNANLSNTLFVNSSSVGIGTNNALEKFDVVGTSRLTGITSLNGIDFDTVNTSGLEIWYNLDEGVTGSKAIDRSGNGRHGTQTNSPTYIDGKFGKALNFAQGSSQYVTVDSYSQTWTAFTIEAWINKTGQDGGHDTILGSNSFRFQIGSGGSLYMQFTAADGAGSCSGNVLTYNTTQHVVVAVSGTTVRLYQNGVQTNSCTAGDGSYAITGLRWGMDGLSGIGSNDAFDGMIDEARVYNSTLTADQVFMHYNRGKTVVADSFSIANNSESPLLYLNKLGSLGLGTTAPNYTLQINSLTNSLNVSNNVFANSTTVGIGVVAPTSKLQVSDTVGGYSTPLAKFYSTANDAKTEGLVFVHSNVSNAPFTALRVKQDGTGNILGLINSSTEIFTVKNTGFVGIGNTAPSSLLHLGTGNITLSGGYITNVSNPLVASDVATKSYVDALNTSSSAADDWNLSGSNLFPKDLAYSVGIGTNDPGQKLDVRGATGVSGFIRVAGGSGGTKGGLYLGNVAGNYGELSFNNSNNNLVLSQQYQSGYLGLGANSSTTQLVLLGNGNVGINNTNPQAKLEVTGDASHGIRLVVNTTTTNLRLFNNGLGLGQTNALGIDFTATSGFGPALSAITGGWETSTARGTLALRTSGDSGATLPERLVILGNGNVGINTTTPGAILDVDGNVSVGNRLAMTPSYFGYNSAWKALVLGSPGTTYTTDAVTLSFGYDPKNNPSGSYTGSGFELLFRNSTYFLQPNATDNGYFSTLQMVDGKVGIRTATTPGAMLDVNGNATFRGNVSLNSNYITGLANPLVSSDAATKAYVDALNASSSGNDEWNLSGSNLFPKSLSYKIGIGVTDPTDPLTIYTGTSGSGLNFIPSGNAGNVTRISFRSPASNASNAAYLDFIAKNNWGYDARLWLGRENGGGGAQNLFFAGVKDDPTAYPNQNTHISFNSNVSEVNSTAVVYIGYGSNSSNTRTSLYTENGAVLAANRGTVGVNSTSPTSTLEVKGTFNASTTNGGVSLQQTGDFKVGI